MNLIEYYTAHYRAGMVDLSVSSPPPVPLPRWAPPPASEMAFPQYGGSRALREAIAARYETLGADDVVVAAGAAEGLLALGLGLGGEGRTVVVHPGAWPSLHEGARTRGSDVLHARDDTEVWAAAVVSATNPSVPGGRWRDVPRVLEGARALGALAVVDEVYRELPLEGAPPAAAADLDAGAVSVGDLSKPLGHGGLRIGWIATRNREVLSTVEPWLRLGASGPSVLSDAAAVALLEGFDALVAAQAALIRERAPAVYAVLDAAGWTYEPAEAGLTVAARPPRAAGAAALAALREAGYFVLPTSTMGDPGAYRISLLADPALLASSLERLAATGD